MKMVRKCCYERCSYGDKILIAASAWLATANRQRPTSTPMPELSSVLLRVFAPLREPNFTAYPPTLTVR
jgi:hypothetical protein